MATNQQISPELQTSPEQPIYVLPQIKARVILPKVVTLAILGAVFYLGVLLNIALLELTAKEETIIKTAALSLLLFVMLLGLVLSIIRAGKSYKFYRNRLEFNKKSVFYTQITNTAQKQGIFDKLFKTYSLQLTDKFTVKHVSKDIQLDNYIRQLIDYAKSQSF